MILPPPRSTLFPYTTLFRSVCVTAASVLSAVSLALASVACACSAAVVAVAAAACTGCAAAVARSEEHTSELPSRQYLVCRFLFGKKQNKFGLMSLIYFRWI